MPHFGCGVIGSRVRVHERYERNSEGQGEPATTSGPRQDLLLAKSRRRDARAYGFGMYRLLDEATSTLVPGEHATGYGYDYDVEGYLNRGL